MLNREDSFESICNMTLIYFKMVYYLIQEIISKNYLDINFTVFLDINDTVRYGGFLFAHNIIPLTLVNSYCLHLFITVVFQIYQFFFSYMLPKLLIL